MNGGQHIENEWVLYAAIFCCFLNKPRHVARSICRHSHVYSYSRRLVRYSWRNMKHNCIQPHSCAACSCFRWICHEVELILAVEAFFSRMCISLRSIAQTHTQHRTLCVSANEGKKRNKNISILKSHNTQRSTQRETIHTVNIKN